jgi:3-methyl-2-oxobutanoate hydroxymethyltransferase
MEISRIKSMKGFQAITCLTAYDFNMGKLLEESNVDIILVGDSVGNVVYGFESTKDVTIYMMVRHTEAVRRGAFTATIVADMPYQSDETPEKALENAKRLVAAGADAVKVEGKPEIVKYLVDHEVFVMGHVGLLPQTASEMKVQGKDGASANKIIEQAKALEKAGAFAMVLETIPMALADTITKLVSIPTIGIGAGPHCDGQVLVTNDMLGMYEEIRPKFVKQYGHCNDEIRKALKMYVKEVKSGVFPDEEHSYQ